VCGTETRIGTSENEGCVILGVGVDITEVRRIEAVIAEHGQRFLDRIFSAGEIQYCRKYRVPFERYAARFAAKEAAMKALGTGWSRGVRWWISK